MSLSRRLVVLLLLSALVFAWAVPGAASDRVTDVTTLTLMEKRDLGLGVKYGAGDRIDVTDPAIVQELLAAGLARSGGTSGDYDASKQLYNWKPENTAQWRRGMARLRSGGGAASISVFGPSTVAGYIGAPGRSEWHAWPSYLRRLLAQQFGESGTGTIYFHEPDSRVMAQGTWDLKAPYGPFGASCFTSNDWNSVLAFGPVRASAFRVTYLTAPGAGKLSVVIPGSGRNPVIIDSNAAHGVARYAVPAGPVGDYQLRIQPVGNGPIFPIAVEGYVSDTYSWVPMGVQVTNVGRGSTVADNLIYGDTVFDSSLKAAVNVNTADLSIVAYMENEPGVHTPEQAKASLRLLIDRIRTTGSNILLMTSIDWQGEPVLKAPQPLYDNAVWELADEYDLPVFDVAARWGRWEEAGGYYADQIHQSPAGNADIAAGVLDVITTGL